MRLVGYPIAVGDADNFVKSAAAHVTAAPSGGEPVGVVTSSTLAPMLSRSPIAFAMVRHKHAAPGTQLWVAAEDGAALPAIVEPGLTFFKR